MSEFQETLRSYLESKGFVKESEDVYKIEKELEQPGQRLVINGQLMNSPPVKIPLRLSITLMGPGSINEEPLEVIKIEMQQGQDLQELTQCFYDFDEFIELFEKILI